MKLKNPFKVTCTWHIILKILYRFDFNNKKKLTTFTQRIKKFNLDTINTIINFNLITLNFVLKGKYFINFIE